MQRRPRFSPAVAISMVAMVGWCLAACPGGAGASFYDEFEVVWGDDPHPERRVEVDDGGRPVVTLTLNNVSGSGFQSRDAFLFGEFTMAIKLVPGDSAGTVTTFYVPDVQGSDGGWGRARRDRLRVPGQRERGAVRDADQRVRARGGQQGAAALYLWFDPTADFHSYTILWNPLNIIFSVDGKPVRAFSNHESLGLPYLSRQAMKVHATIWDGDAWATRGGRDKTDWSHAPFVASYATYPAAACVSSSPSSPAASDGGAAPAFCCPGDAAWLTRRLGPDGERAVAWAREKYMVMDYCDDPWHIGRPAECDVDRLI